MRQSIISNARDLSMRRRRCTLQSENKDLVIVLMDEMLDDYYTSMKKSVSKSDESLSTFVILHPN